MKRAIACIAAGLTACATPGARPHDMSEAAHEAHAAQHDREAAEHAKSYEPGALQPLCRSPGRSRLEYAYDVCWFSVVNPTEVHQQEADRHHQMAAEHRKGSAALREAEARACAGIAAGDRDMSPFEHREDLAAVSPLVERSADGAQRTAGATITFRAVEGLTAARLQRLVDCHLARNSALGHQAQLMPDCPLVPKGASARVGGAADALTVAVRADDPAAGPEILARARRLVGAPVSAR